MRTTFMAKANEVERKWYVVDASDKILGRLASQIAKILRGKHKPEYTPHADAGDYVVVLNSSQVKVTGKKEKEKIYYRHSGYPGGIKETTLETLRAKKPNQIIENAVKGMLPKNPLGRAMLRKLKVYSGSEHPHDAQQPEEINFENEKQDFCIGLCILSWGIIGKYHRTITIIMVKQTIIQILFDYLPTHLWNF